MDLWILINPILKFILYAAIVGSVGSFLFSLHFTAQLTEQQQSYCYYLSRKSVFIGAITSLLMILTVPGNLGGDLRSLIDPLMLQLAIESNSGVGYLIAAAGFVVMLAAHKIRGKAQKCTFLIGSIAVLFSLTLAGHALLGKWLTQSLLILHLLGITFWLGALLPFRWICLQTDTTNLSALAHRFGLVALVYVGLIIITGLAYAYTLLGELSLIFTTSYGNVLLIKLLLVAALLSLAALNKFWIVPSLEQNPVQGVRHFKTSLQFEIALTLIILLAVSLLTTSLTLPTG
mgnify:FL=1